MPFLIQEAAIEARVAARKATTIASITGVPIVSLSSLVQDFDASSRDVADLIVDQNHMTGRGCTCVAQVERELRTGPSINP